MSTRDKKKTRLYLAGPMTGYTDFNFPSFDKAAAMLRRAGYEVVNPAEHDRELGFDPTGLTGNESARDTGYDIETALDWDLRAIATCDGIALLDSTWQTSRGACLEVALAGLLGLTIAYVSAWKILDYTKFVTSRTEFTDQVPRKEENRALAWLHAYRNSKGEAYTKILLRDSYAGVYANSGVSNTAGANNTVYVGYEDGDGDILWGGIGKEKALEAGRKLLDKMNGEVRTTSSTGGQKGIKLARYDLLPVDALRQVAEHYGKGAQKYDDNNWRKGYEWSKSYAAMMRHLNQFWGGEDIDPETGSKHLAAVVFHALGLIDFYDSHPEFDDRYKA